MAAVHDARRPAALRRRQGPPGIPPRRRPRSDDRTGPLRLRHRRQRHVRAPGENFPDFPQRKQDIPKAKKLLAEAGYPDGLEVELVTAPIQSGVVEAAQVFAQQAAEAGIRVKIRKVDATTFFGDEYLQWDFAQDFWYTRDFLPQCVSCSMDESPFNETHWDDPGFTKIVEKARGISDSADRKNLEHEAQKQLYDDGGYIIWGFANQVDAYQKYVGGPYPTPPAAR